MDPLYEIGKLAVEMHQQKEFHKGMASQALHSGDVSGNTNHSDMANLCGKLSKDLYNIMTKIKINN